MDRQAVTTPTTGVQVADHVAVARASLPPCRMQLCGGSFRILRIFRYPPLSECIPGVQTRKTPDNWSDRRSAPCSRLNDR